MAISCDIRDRDARAGVESDEFNGGSGQKIGRLNILGRLPMDNPFDAVSEAGRFAPGTPHQTVEQFRGQVAAPFEIGKDAGKRGERVFADGLVVVHADDGDLLGDADAGLEAGVQHLFRLQIQRGHHAAWLGQRNQPFEHVPLLKAPVVHMLGFVDGARASVLPQAVDKCGGAGRSPKRLRRRTYESELSKPLSQIVIGHGLADEPGILVDGMRLGNGRDGVNKDGRNFFRVHRLTFERVG